MTKAGPLAGLPALLISGFELLIWAFDIGEYDP
jgi:hypothetical protein